MYIITTQYYSTPYGELILGAYNDKLCLCDWRYRKMRDAVDKRLSDALSAMFIEGESSILEETKRQLDAYFLEQRKDFDLPILLLGTSFQKKVWTALQTIPYGTTVSYLDLAEMVNKPEAIRAVAGANGANALSLIIPCHRVVGSNGELTGYAGGLSAKEKLLHLEHGMVTLPLF